jgi:SAM-dependent methyltransferase
MESPILGPHDDWDVHWDDYAMSAEDNPAQLYRRRLVLKRLGRRPERILDIGSGQGDLAKDLTIRFPASRILGLEVSLSGVRTSEAKVPTAVFLQRDLLDANQQPGPYAGWATHATCSEVLEHVDDPGLLLQQSQRYMSPGCRVIVTVPGGPMSAFDRHIGHRRHYSAEALRAVLESAGLVVEDVSQAGFPFFNLYRLAVVLRGRRLVDDVSSRQAATSSRLIRLAMSSFRRLFLLNKESTPWGWQVVATARLPESEG